MDLDELDRDALRPLFFEESAEVPGVHTLKGNSGSLGFANLRARL